MASRCANPSHALCASSIAFLLFQLNPGESSSLVHVASASRNSNHVVVVLVFTLHAVAYVAERPLAVGVGGVGRGGGHGWCMHGVLGYGVLDVGRQHLVIVGHYELIRDDSRLLPRGECAFARMAFKLVHLRLVDRLQRVRRGRGRVPPDVRHLIIRPLGLDLMSLRTHTGVDAV
ncbi:hypothetical protein KC357_g181 [Hortaea werneckii]|nr:hypothetical protein KC357_g181 [Hortaea werneckii]